MNELWALWDRCFPRGPSHHNRHYVEARLAHKLQEEAFGGLKPEARERRLAIGEAHSRIKRRAREIHIVPGTLLVREYGEREHRVTTLPDGGFDYEGRGFRSLSAVARFIIGQH